jgi:hypothetical protein
MTNSNPAGYLATRNPHNPVPEGGTYKRERDGQVARLANESDYPVVAECKICRGRIRLGSYLQWDWYHAPLEVTAKPAGEAS